MSKLYLDSLDPEVHHFYIEGISIIADDYRIINENVQEIRFYVQGNCIAILPYNMRNSIEEIDYVGNDKSI